jgi:hypothetical protein
MPRVEIVALKEVWKYVETRERLMSGLVQLKLPINEAEYPESREMRQLSFGCSPVTGKSGPLVNMWLLGRHIAFRQDYFWHPTSQLNTVFSGYRYGSDQQALQVFASLVAVNDEPSRGEPMPRLWGGRSVEVVDLDGQSTVESLINQRYRIHRQAGATGFVLCRARREHSGLWLVEHDGQVAAYADHELVVQ